MMRRRIKKTKTVNNKNLQTSEEKNKFDQLPLDLVIEILGRLPVKSVARFLTVSKLWDTTIHSPDFIRSYPCGSSSKPLTLIASSETDLLRERKDWDFFFSQSSSSTSLLSRVTCPFPYYFNEYDNYHHVNGLISFGDGQKQIVTNPSTHTSITLPRVKTRRSIVRSFFGYGSVNDHYKVLCMTVKRYGDQSDESSEHQVFTLGAKNKSWRMIDCSIDPHRPCSNGVCIDSVVYYVAKTGAGMLHLSLMRFDLRSENLDLLTSVPEEIRPPSDLYIDTLINYEGKVAIPTEPTSYTYDVWIMDQDSEKHEWLKKLTFSIEPWKSSFLHVRVKGTTHTGEFVFTSPYYSDDVYIYVFHYNPDMNSFRSTKVERIDAFKCCGTRAMVFSDYVESVRFL